MTDTPAVPTETGWKVLTQRPDQQFDVAGNFTNGVSVNFQTKYGVVGTVFIPDSQYTVDRAKQIIGERAAVLDGVSGLTGQG